MSLRMKSLVLAAATALSLGEALAQQRVDVDPSRIQARIPSSAGGFRKNWEGFATTNYLSTEQFLFTPPTAQVAAGPTNIITVVNRRIAIYDNPNSIVSVTPNNPPNSTPPGPTRRPQVLSPTSYLPTNEALIDSWLGEGVLNNLCPTGSQSNISCLVDNATVRYDQLHGRYIVALTVTDTGVQTIGAPISNARKASWVVLISKFSTFAQFGQAGSSDIFINPTPPGGSTGGVNTANWSIYYGNALNGLGTDGFGNVTTGLTTIGPGNINSVPGLAPSSPGDATLFQDAAFGCGPGEVGNQQLVGPTNNRACYFPTSLRIGIDNDSIILASAVVNTNYFLPPSPNPVMIPQFAGTRVRVIKKGGATPGGPGGSPSTSPAGLYQKSLTQTASSTVALTPGNQFAATEATRFLGDYYDIFAGDQTTGTPLAVSGSNSGTTIVSPYTLAPTLGGQARGEAAFCEPARVRGRAAASYTNSLVPTLTSQNYIECVVSTLVIGGNQSRIYIQPIVYIPQNPGNVPANVNFAVPFYPVIRGNGTTIGSAPGNGMQFAVVDPFADALPVPQGTYLGTTGGPAAGTQSPEFFVGDSRVHELVYREGHLYGARVANANPPANVSVVEPEPGPLTDERTSTFQVNGNPLSATVLYDVIQVLIQSGPSAGQHAGTAGLQRNPVLLTKWNNTFAYAPMFDVPANVVTAGQLSPINTFPWLEKLFVATTYPQLTASDPRVNEQVGTGTGVATVREACTSSNQIPNVIGGISTTRRGYPGLYDVRCSMDVFDARQNFRNPITGQLTTFTPIPGQLPTMSTPGDTTRQPIVPSLRGGASTDPNNGSLWVFGLYANRRFAGVANNGQLGSYVANYDLSFPNTDPYGNTTPFFSDCNSTATCGFFVQVQTAAQLGLAVPKADGTLGLNDAPTRAEMARLVVLSMMDETAIAAFLNATGGCTTSFADVASECQGTNASNVGVTPPALTAANSAGYWRYIETMYRKRITTGCLANDARREFCPTRTLRRDEMAVFIVRAKFGNVYPSVISGCPSPQTPGCPGIVGGDNFGLTVGANPYFADVPASNVFFVYIQKMYEMRITNGTTPPPGIPTYAPETTLTRGELLTFIVRSFYF
jgi:hypothetical protein